MSHLIIQIPAYNEAETIGATLAALPRQVPGFTKVEWLLIDDGSRDRTVEIARAQPASTTSCRCRTTAGSRPHSWRASRRASSSAPT